MINKCKLRQLKCLARKTWTSFIWDYNNDLTARHDRLPQLIIARHRDVTKS